MDKIQGWDEEEQKVRSKFATRTWIYRKKALTKKELPSPAMEEHLKKRMLSIILCANWVCAGTFVNHEWVSEGTSSSQHEEEMLGMQLDYGLDVPCVAQL